MMKEELGLIVGRVSIFVVCIVCFLNTALSQNRTITVRVLDSKTQKPVSEANVFIDNKEVSIATNYLGYFQATIPKTVSEMFISHIGYEKGITQIPTADKFTALLTPMETELDQLDLAIDSISFSKNKRNTFLTVSPDSSHEIHSNFNGGWEKFYKQLMSLIGSDKGYTKAVFEAHVHFTINEDGTLTNVFVIPDTVSNARVIVHALSNIKGFISASQNKKNTKETFKLKVYFEDDRLFTSVEQQPEYIGGYEAMMNFIRVNMRYPVSARREGVDGTVYAKFIINQDGSLSNIEITKGIQKDCDDEVRRLISKMPKWKPGMIAGKPVKVAFNLPVKFKLNGSSNETKASRDHVVSPSFPGGYAKLESYLKNNKNQIKELPPPNKFSNVVLLKFVVDSLGQIGKIRVNNSLGTAFDNEAIRLFASMPLWIPGRLNGKARNVEWEGAVDFNTISQTNQSAATESFSKGVQTFNKGNNVKALEYFNLAIEKNPTELNFFFNRAVVLIRLTKIKDACSDLILIKDTDQEAKALYGQYCTGQ
jgi:TonB family protein